MSKRGRFYLAFAGGVALLYGGIGMRQSLLCGAAIGVGSFVIMLMVLALCAAASGRWADDES